MKKGKWSKPLGICDGGGESFQAYANKTQFRKEEFRGAKEQPENMAIWSRKSFASEIEYIFSLIYPGGRCGKVELVFPFMGLDFGARLLALLVFLRCVLKVFFLRRSACVVFGGKQKLDNNNGINYKEHLKETRRRAVESGWKKEENVVRGAGNSTPLPLPLPVPLVSVFVANVVLSGCRFALPRSQPTQSGANQVLVEVVK
ncbi:GD11749 [Drosophila simulans]|uniref:GD11749 n=1 Tax=Drosophila simulans TaxID=7240 RepID=B4QIL7_DROSI|nr:GD11749 [Drosophila simulans]